MIAAVRSADVGDWPAMAWLQDEARGHLAGQRGGPEWLAEHPMADESLFDPPAGAGRLAVATIDEVVVGWCRTELGAGAGSAVVEWIYVTPGARGLGLGEELLDDAIAAARSAGAARIESSALPGDRETKNMFERFGMKARLLIVGKSLADEAR